MGTNHERSMTSYTLSKLDSAYFFLYILALLVVLSGCTSEEQTHRYLTIDTHIDTPYRNYRNELNIFDGTNTGQFDVPRAMRGDLSVAFMSIYTPAFAAEEGRSKQIAIEQIDWVLDMTRQSDDIALVTCSSDARKAFHAGKLGLALGMENGSPLEGEPTNLAPFIDQGIRYVTLAHSRSNEFSDSSYDDNEAHGGLSDAGRRLVKYMNEHGVMIDISHLTDDAAWQVLELTESPVVATHSSLRHFIPGFHRNMSDEMVSALKKNGGIIHINFGSSFVSNEAREWQTKLSAKLDELAENSAMTQDDRLAIANQYREENPYPFANVKTVVDHIDRVVELAGVEHVGLGSDFDGVGETLPIGLKDASMYPNLVPELKARGYDSKSIELIFGENLMRVWSVNEEIAEKYGNPPPCSLAFDGSRLIQGPVSSRISKQPT